MQDTFFYRKKTLRLRDRLINLHSPVIMAIINLTQDSFFSGSRADSEKAFESLLNKHIQEGAHIIDIGACSTRPGALATDVALEKTRIQKALKHIKKHSNIAVSVDTSQLEVAKIAIENGADIINDVSFGREKKIVNMCIDQHIPYIMMHSKGTPQTMGNECHYNHLGLEVLQDLKKFSINYKHKGGNDLIIDPGFGFAKNMEQNYQLLENLKLYRCFFSDPILMGVSRKSMVYKALKTNPEGSLYGSMVLHQIGLLSGVDIFRVHDVQPMKDLIDLFPFCMDAFK